MDDDTPIEWSFHSSPYQQQQHHQQQQHQQHQHQHQAPEKMIAISSLPFPSPSPSPPVVKRTRKAPSPSPPEAAGTPSPCSILGPKRARLDGHLRQEQSTSINRGFLPLPGGINLGSARGSGAPKHGKPEEARRSADDADRGGGSRCSFQWSKRGDYQRDSQWGSSGTCSSSSCRSAEAGDRQLGGGNAAGLQAGGGASATHPSGMDVAVGVGGDRHEARPNSEHLGGLTGLNGGGEGGVGLGFGGGGGSGDQPPGGGAVISSGFGAGGFPKHQWHQDQGGSSDDMLILYGSPS